MFPSPIGRSGARLRGVILARHTAQALYVALSPLFRRGKFRSLRRRGTHAALEGMSHGA